MIKRPLLAACCLALAGCMTTDGTVTGPREILYQIDVDEKFTTSSNGFVSEPNPVVTTKWRVQTHEGEIVICGARALVQPSKATISSTMLAKMHVVYEGREIMRDMRFFQRTPGGAQAEWDKANCVSTGTPAPTGAYTVYLEWDAGRYRI